MLLNEQLATIISANFSQKSNFPHASSYIFYSAVIHVSEMEIAPFSLLQYVLLAGMQLELEEVACRS